MSKKKKVAAALIAGATVASGYVVAQLDQGVDTEFVPFLRREVPTEQLDERVFITDNSFKDFGARAARKTFALKGTGVEVCVIDTGVDPIHEQIDSRLVAFADFTPRPQITAYDDHGHGTHVASIVLGDGVGTSEQAKKYIGVAPRATLSVAKVLDASGSGSVEQVIEGIDWCAARNADVINMSLSTQSPVPAMDSAVNRATSLGVTVVVSAGNAGPIPGAMGSPSVAASAITVGAAADWSAPDGVESAIYSDGPYLSPFSSRGPPFTADIKPDVVGPGVTIVAASAHAGSQVPGTFGGYHAWSGTSMSSPYVAGTVALMLQADPALSPADVKTILADTALDLGKPGKDIDYGWGYVNSYSAIAAVQGVAGEDIFPPHQTVPVHIEPGGDFSMWLMVNDIAQPIAATSIAENALHPTNPMYQFGWPQYGMVAYAVNALGTVDYSMCPYAEPLHIGWCGNGASGRTQVVSGMPKLIGMPGTTVYPGNHVLFVFPNTIGTDESYWNRSADLTIDIFWGM